jgi:hypothetical protein
MSNSKTVYFLRNIRQLFCELKQKYVRQKIIRNLYLGTFHIYVVIRYFDFHYEYLFFINYANSLP